MLRGLVIGLVIVFAVPGCSRPRVIVTSPTAPAPVRRDARWTLTYPQLAGTPYVVTSGDVVYVLACGVQAKLSKIERGGRIAWTRPLGPCFAGLAQPLAVHGDRIVVGMTTEVAGGKAGARVTTFDPSGTVVWQVEVLGELVDVGVASTTDRAAFCFAPRSAVALGTTAIVDGGMGYVIVELDGKGGHVATHAIDRLYDSAARCAYDPARDLWLTAKWDYAAEVDVAGIKRAIGAGTWGLRLTGKRRFLPLFQTSSTWATKVDDGWIVYEYKESLTLVDHDGAKRWHLPFTNTGCTPNAKVIAASLTRLVVNLDIYCEVQGGSTTFADLTIHDRSERGSGLGEREVIAEIDTTTQSTRILLEPKGPDNARYVETPNALIAYGQFSGPLGFGTRQHTQPPEYRCMSTLPHDAQTWSTYASKTPSCRDGFYLDIDYPTWPFIARLTR